MARIGGAEALRAVIPGVTTATATGPKCRENRPMQFCKIGETVKNCRIAHNTWVFKGSEPLSAPVFNSA